MRKKLVQINVVCNGSTGRIMNQIQQEAISQGWEAYSFMGEENLQIITVIRYVVN